LHEQFKAPTKLAGLRYHAHIDGLRAIAILAVVADHVGMPGFQGGFVGVDVFFVISGFLIITQILEGLRSGSFSFGDFWSRRALRILPPLLLVIVACVGLGSLVSVTYGQFFELGQEAFHAALMVINHLLLSQQGYFDVSAQTKPFLHLWSLAVEEQFYFVAPLILVALTWAFKRRPKIALSLAGVMFVASLLACIVFSASGRGLAFYLVPTRAWEFIAGGALGLLLPFGRQLSSRSIEGLGVAGGMALLAPIILFQPTPLYPSVYAVVPVLGSCLLIFAGLLQPETFTAKLLASKPMRAIGLISYAWYLWHWPLIVFTRLYDFGQPALLPDALAALVALGLAVLTHFWVERPIRDWRRRAGKQMNWWPALAGVAVTVLVGYGASTFGQQMAWAQPKAPKGVEQMDDSGACRIDVMSDPAGCLALAGSRPMGLLIGDSHGMAAYMALSGYATANGSHLATLTIPDCAPMLGVTTFELQREHKECTAGHRTATDVIAGNLLPIRYVVVYARWNLYAGDQPIVDKHNPELLGPLGATAPAADQRSLFVSELRRTIGTLQQHGVGKILVVAPTPEFGQDANDCVLRANKMQLGSDATCAVPRADVDRLRQSAVDQLTTALAGLDGVRLIDPLPLFCDANRCSASHMNAPQFRDNNHLNGAAEERLIAGFTEDFAWLTSAAL
jgi:peptidoglycan/LPS O-acetylase OafA/YrhL